MLRLFLITGLLCSFFLITASESEAGIKPNGACCNCTQCSGGTSGMCGVINEGACLFNEGIYQGDGTT